LDAYERFRERNPGTNFRLVVAGGVNEEKRSYFKKVKERATNIKGVKVRSNVPGDQWGALYSNAYAVLFCAMNEDWGITPIEAGSYEKPVISVNEGGPTESIVDGETGILVNDADEMVDAMERVTSNERLTRSMGTQAKKRSRKYTWERFVAQFDETVSEVVTRFESSAGQ
jgi:alpha-1,3/alpha-1,6-mannosyltransferase